MALSDKHPEYTSRLPEWIQMSDTYEGERAVKAKRLDYLPATEGMVQDGMVTPTSPGWKDYEAYLLRAYFHDVVKDAIKAMIGIMHAKPAVITLPKRMQPLLDNATLQGEGLHTLLRRINVAQLKHGRLGLLADAPTGLTIDEAIPYIAFYDAQRIINWDAGKENEGKNQLQLVVLDEGGMQRKGFTWQTEIKYRILARGGAAVLEDGDQVPGPEDPFGVAIKVGNTNLPVPDDFVVPEIGGRPMFDIPFVFIGANDLVPEPETPPLLGLSNLSLVIYRAEADYRQTLYLQGQQTLVIIGAQNDEAAPSEIRVGNKGVIDLRLEGDAKYIGVSADGLGEMRQSLKTDQDAAAAEGVSFLDAGNGASAGESGEALRIRVAARTTTIASVAKAGGAGLEQVLKHIAVWLGEDPNEVKVQPTTDFADQTVAGAALLAFMQAKQLGLPLSLRSMHRMMRLNDMTEMDFEEENVQIEEEAESMLGMMVGPLQQPGQQPGADDPFLDDPTAAGDTSKPGQPASGPASTAPPARTTPVTPHVRGSPVPLKKKVGPKGASAGKAKK